MVNTVIRHGLEGSEVHKYVISFVAIGIQSYSRRMVRCSMQSERSEQDADVEGDEDQGSETLCTLCRLGCSSWAAGRTYVCVFCMRTWHDSCAQAVADACANQIDQFLEKRSDLIKSFNDFGVPGPAPEMESHSQFGPWWDLLTTTYLDLTAKYVILSTETTWALGLLCLMTDDQENSHVLLAVS